jgi:mRNA-degrading endonuclease HigB of HigAB toxin-antitoxin module
VNKLNKFWEKFWGKNAAFYPRLSILTKKYFAIPASYVQMYPQNEYLVLQVI